MLFNEYTYNEDFETVGDLCNYIKESFIINESILLNDVKINKAKNLYNNSMKDKVEFLTKRGIDIEKIVKDNKKGVEKLVSNIQKTKMDKQGMLKISKMVSSEVAKVKENVITSITNGSQEILEDMDTSDEIKCVCIICVVVTINSLFLIILSLLFGQYAMIILAVIVAPVTEELGKLVATKSTKDNGTKYNIMFNVYEAGSYILRLVVSGISLPMAIGIRIPAVIMHTVNQMIIKYKYKKDIENQDTNAGSMAVIITMLIHGIFNGLAITAQILSTIK